MFTDLHMHFSGAAVPVAYQCWVLPCLCPSPVLQSPLLPMDFTVYSSSSWGSRAHCGLIFLPALSTPLKKPNKQTFHLPKKTPKNKEHPSISIHLIILGLWARFLTAIAETLESAPEQQKLLSLAPRSNQIGVYFIALINFLLTVLEVCEEERREREEKSCSGM